MTRVGLISDTHGLLRAQVLEVFDGVDLILHAGDIGALDVLVELGTVAPVHAVLGNTDSASLRGQVRDEVRLHLEGRTIVVVHGHMFGSPNALLLHGAYPDAHVIVYGHTHVQRLDHVDGCVIVNPGAAGPARFNLKPSVAVLTLAEGEEPGIELVSLREKRG